MGNMELLAGALQYLENHLEDEIGTEDVAAACFCSRSTLEKLFRCVNNISVREYLVRRRMMKAARRLAEEPQVSILDVALQYGYGSNEAFCRAFKQIWNCKPSEFRERQSGKSSHFSELFPRLTRPVENGDAYMRTRKAVDISELYDFFTERKNCYFVCCDIQNLLPINDFSRKAGDIAILTSMQRMEAAAGENDIVFRIGGDEFALLTDSTEEAYAQSVADKISKENGKVFEADGKEFPLGLYTAVARFDAPHIRYQELFTGLHKAIEDCK